MTYQVQWTLKAAKQAKKLHASDRAMVIERVGSLASWPECKETHDIKPLTRHQYQYRLRVGRYRVLFDVETGLQVVSIEEVKNAMNALIDYQISEQAGRRYAVLPLEQFTALVERAGEVDALTLPHEIVSRHLVDDVPLTRCWREYLDITQAEIARRLSVSQAQVAQWESARAKPRHTTLKKLATAMGIHIRQLTLED